MPLAPLAKTSGMTTNIYRNFKALVALMTTMGLLMLCNVLQMLSALFLPFSRSLVRTLNRWIGGSWWAVCDIMAEKWGIDVQISGADLPMRENVMVTANHQAMTDINTLFRLARRQGRIGDLKWFVKDIIKYVPGVGWGMIFLDCIFLKRNWKKDRDRLFNQLSRFHKEQIPIWTLSFVEGTRIRPHKHEASVEYAQSIGVQPLNHLLLPRTKGFCLTLEALRDHLDAVYDATIGYVEGVPTLWQWCRGDVQKVALYVRRFPISEMPHDEAELTEWLKTRWREKDELLAYFYTHGEWPSDSLTSSSTPTPQRVSHQSDLSSLA
jgi:1-acyl-sn-glycerol-3-phosphate acyltransferase